MRSPSDFGRVLPGEIIVCPYTDPAWTPLFTISAEPSHSSAPRVGTSLESVHDIEHVRDEEPEHVAWTVEAARAVLKELDAQGHTQADVSKDRGSEFVGGAAEVRVAVNSSSMVCRGKPASWL